MVIPLYVFVLLLGLIFGSFINCLVWRLHQGESLWNRSYCPHCRAKIHWYDNIPLVSFALLKGKCRACQQKISWQYPLTEFFTAILFVFIFYVHTKGFSDSLFLEQIMQAKIILMILRDWILVLALAAIFIMDLRWQVIVDKVSLPTALIVLIINLYLGMAWQALLLSAIIGTGFFLFFFLISDGKWMGGGDIRLGLIMGLALSPWIYVLIALMLANILGAIIGLGIMLIQKKKFGTGIKIPFGPFLVIATIITMFWGQELLNLFLPSLHF